jgi:hypothetical protein
MLMPGRQVHLIVTGQQDAYRIIVSHFVAYKKIENTAFIILQRRLIVLAMVVFNGFGGRRRLMVTNAFFSGNKCRKFLKRQLGSFGVKVLAYNGFPMHILFNFFGKGFNGIKVGALPFFTFYGHTAVGDKVNGMVAVFIGLKVFFMTEVIKKIEKGMIEAAVGVRGEIAAQIVIKILKAACEKQMGGFFLPDIIEAAAVAKITFYKVQIVRRFASYMVCKVVAVIKNIMLHKSSLAC